MTREPFGFRPSEQRCQPPFVQWSGDNRLLSQPECDAIVELGESSTLQFGTVGNGSNHDYRDDRSYRCVQTRALWPNDAPWLYEKLRERIRWANESDYRADLTGIQEGLQFLRYDTPDGVVPAGHYKWHQDFGGGVSSNRKLSLVCQLSRPEDYDGCELHLFTDCDFVPPYRQQGDAILFPSWTPHMVAPITRGRRYALVAWISGPQWR